MRKKEIEIVFNEHKLQGQSGPFGRIALEVYVRREKKI